MEDERVSQCAPNEALFAERCGSCRTNGCQACASANAVDFCLPNIYNAESGSMRIQEAGIQAHCGTCRQEPALGQQGIHVFLAAPAPKRGHPVLAGACLAGLHCSNTQHFILELMDILQDRSCGPCRKHWIELEIAWDWIQLA
eukprot:scaffold202582_cov19-Tisochrysis_lutea.AAC.1